MQVSLYYHIFDKNQSSHGLLKLALKHYLRENGMEMEYSGITVMKEIKSGKPYLKEFPNVHFSISHSGDWWICAYGAQEVGLDLQLTKPKDQKKTADRFFHPREIAWLEGKESAQFYRLWAYKESYVKYTGKGLREGLSYFSAVPEKAGRLGADGVFQQEIPFPDPEYWLVLTSKEKAEFKLYDLGAEHAGKIDKERYSENSGRN